MDPVHVPRVLAGRPTTDPGGDGRAGRPVTSGPQVVAHRGASDEHPEHTLGAYRRAIEAGADALECDVRMTADGHLVCVHDRRVERTSNGRGRVSDLELTQLEGLDWASWKQDAADPTNPEEPDRDRGRLLTLNRLLEVVADAGRPLELAVETKHPTRHAGLVEQRLVESLQRFGWAGRTGGRTSPVRMMSFSLLAVQRVRAMAPELELVYLMERVPLRFRDGTLPRGVGTAGVSMAVVRAHPRFVLRQQRAGHAVHVYTVDTPIDVERCVELGVDAIITNRPRQVLEHLGR